MAKTCQVVARATYVLLKSVCDVLCNKDSSCFCKDCFRNPLGIGWTGIEEEKGFKIHNINKVTVKQYTKRPIFGFHSVERNCFRMDMNDLQTVKQSYRRRHRAKKRA